MNYLGILMQRHEREEERRFAIFEEIWLCYI